MAIKKTVLVVIIFSCVSQQAYGMENWRNLCNRVQQQKHAFNDWVKQRPTLHNIVLEMRRRNAEQRHLVQSAWQHRHPHHPIMIKPENAPTKTE